MNTNTLEITASTILTRVIAPSDPTLHPELARHSPRVASFTSSATSLPSNKRSATACTSHPGTLMAFSGKDLLANTYTVKANFFGGDVANRDGIRVATKNLDNDGHADIVVGVGRRIIGYSGANIAPSGTPTAILDYEVSSTLTEGVFVG